MKINLLDLSKQYQTIKSEVNFAINDVLNKSEFIMGNNVMLFEREIAEFVGTKYAISCANGTDALVLALKSIGIGIGDEVITTPYTFFATAEAISLVGAIPVFVDVDINTYNINPELIEKKITDKTKAILPVHIFGQPAQMCDIISIAKKYNLYIIEDACQAIGASYKGIKCGALGDIACFSFFPTKNLGAYGDGGMITTNNEKIYKILKALRTHGGGKAGEDAYNIINNMEEKILNNEEPLNETFYNSLKYYNYIIGCNSRLDELQAAILRVKLKRLDNWNNQRILLATRYNKQFSDTQLIVPFTSDEIKSVYHLYILQSNERDSLTKYLLQHNISSGIYYPVPIHLQKVYKQLGYSKGDMPISEYLSCRTFAIPLYPELTYEQQDYIIETIKNFYKE